MSSAKRRRTRYVCSHCNLSLQHTAYRRHQLLPDVYCPAHNDDTESSSGSDSTFELSESENQSMDMSVEPPQELSSVSGSVHASASSSSEFDEHESATDVWDAEGSDSNASSSDQGGEEAHSHLQFIVSVFLSFFQLCFRISDRAMVYLLSFLSALFQYLASHAKDVPLLKHFADGSPKTLYYLRSLKILNPVCEVCGVPTLSFIIQ